MLQMLGSTRPFTMQVFKINVEKTVQAIAVLLTAVGHRRLEYLSIIKQLYFADRESWGETGAPITGDVPVAMKNGPVLSGVYDLVTHDTDNGLEYWTRFLHKEDYDLELKADPGRDLLSRYEIGKLQEVSARHKDHNWRDLVRISHEVPEWQWNNPDQAGCKMIPIPLGDILKAVGRENDAEEIMKDAAADVAFRKALGS
jgi:hypothetical protein